MKKILTFALCVAAVSGMHAQKQAVDNAQKLAGKVAQIEDARKLIKGAMENPETSNEARTYYVAGKIEFDAFDKLAAAQKINPADVDIVAMYNGLLQGADYFKKAIPMEAAEPKQKLTKDMVAKLVNHAPQYFEAGGNLFNSKQYYPGAYEAFMLYGQLPDMTDILGDKAPALPDADRATAFFNAGLAAYSGNQVLKAADAFRAARDHGYADPQGYIYEIACWQNLAQNDSTLTDQANARIADVAMAGFKTFGLEQPVFINNLINSMVTEDRFDDALAMMNEEISANPNSPALYGLRGYVNDRAGREAESEADYRKAVSLPDVDFETLKNAAKKIYRLGAEKWNLIEGNSPEAQAARQDVKTNYFEAAKAITEQAKAINANDSDLQYVIENIDYALETYFN